jgi:hypothetical protein
MRRMIGLALVSMALLAACGGALTMPVPSPGGTGRPGPTPAGPASRITGTVTAGPVCPVEANPPDPACVPRPVEGAVIVAVADDGSEVGRATTAADGTYAIDLARTGMMTISGEPVQGLMGVPKPEQVDATAPGQVVQVDLVYDTGIR